MWVDSLSPEHILSCVAFPLWVRRPPSALQFVCCLHGALEDVSFEKNPSGHFLQTVFRSGVPAENTTQFSTFPNTFTADTLLTVSERLFPWFLLLCFSYQCCTKHQAFSCFTSLDRENKPCAVSPWGGPSLQYKHKFVSLLPTKHLWNVRGKGRRVGCSLVLSVLKHQGGLVVHHILHTIILGHPEGNCCVTAGIAFSKLSTHRMLRG